MPQINIFNTLFPGVMSFIEDPHSLYSLDSSWGIFFIAGHRQIFPKGMLRKRFLQNVNQRSRSRAIFNYVRKFAKFLTEPENFEVLQQEIEFPVLNYSVLKKNKTHVLGHFWI